MQVATYKIERWDPIMSGNSITPHPAVYIVPDKNFLNFSRNNSFSAYCNITESDTVYNNKLLKCTINKSSVVPNCRPNFYANSGLYIISLDTFWLGGYPKSTNLGVIEFYGFSSPVIPFSDTSNDKIVPLLKEKQCPKCPKCPETDVKSVLNDLGSVLLSK